MRTANHRLLVLGLLSTSCSSAAAPSDTDPNARRCEEAPTYHADVAPILKEHCIPCHTAGPGAATSGHFDDSETVIALADPIAAAVANRTMPPWAIDVTDACNAPLPFVGDLGLTVEEIQVVTAWAAAGGCEGEPDAAAQIDAAAEVISLDGTKTYAIGGSTAVGAGDSKDQHWCYPIEAGLQNESWIAGFGVKPGAADVIRRVTLYLDPRREGFDHPELANNKYPCFGDAGVTDAQVLGAWMPGSGPIAAPPNSGFRASAGGSFVIQIHYSPSRADAFDDATTLDVAFLPEAPTYEAQMFYWGIRGGTNFAAQGLQPGSRGELDFEIPAGAEQHTETVVPDLGADLNSDVQLWGVIPQQHFRGVEQTATLRKSDGSEVCLFKTSHWDFGWQRFYRYEGDYTSFPTVSPDDVLTLTCRYNNTRSNDNLVDYLIAHDDRVEKAEDILLEDVRSGDDPGEEMCVFAAALVYPRPPR
jgi:hypothetical protein